MALGASYFVKPVQQMPLVIPDPETERVEVTGPAACRGDSNHRHMLRRNVRTAAIAHLSAAWSQPEIRQPFVRQTTLQESAPNHETNNIEVHTRALSDGNRPWSAG